MGKKPKSGRPENIKERVTVVWKVFCNASPGTVHQSILSARLKRVAVVVPIIVFFCLMSTEEKTFCSFGKCIDDHNKYTWLLI